MYSIQGFYSEVCVYVAEGPWKLNFKVHRWDEEPHFPSFALPNKIIYVRLIVYGLHQSLTILPGTDSAPPWNPPCSTQPLRDLSSTTSMAAWTLPCSPLGIRKFSKRHTGTWSKGKTILEMQELPLSWFLTFTATRGSNGPKSFLKRLALLYYRYLNTKTSFYSSTNHFPFITYGYKSWNNNIWFLTIFICNPHFLGSEIPSWV